MFVNTVPYANQTWQWDITLKNIGFSAIIYINGEFSIAMLDCQRVNGAFYSMQARMKDGCQSGLNKTSKPTRHKIYRIYQNGRSLLAPIWWFLI